MIEVINIIIEDVQSFIPWLQKDNFYQCLDQVIDNIQVELVKLVEHVVLITKSKQLVVVVIEASQLVQPIVEPVHIENPQFPITQLVPIFGHSIDNLKHISMFLEQVA